MLLSRSTCAVSTRPQRNVAARALNVNRREIIEAGAAALLLPGMLPTSASAAAEKGGAYDFEALQYDATVPLSKYKGQVLVVVNIASE
jgi:hypothetical protein